MLEHTNQIKVSLMGKNDQLKKMKIKEKEVIERESN